MSRTTLTTHADENGTYTIKMNFSDEDDAGLAPNSAKWTLTDMKGTAINSRSSVDIVSPSSEELVTLSGDDLAISDNKDRKVCFTVYGTYTSSYVTSGPFEDECIFTIDKHVKNKT